MARASTVKFMPTFPFTTNGCQVAPFQRAMRFTAVPPALPKEPPTTSVPLYTTIAYTAKLAPLMLLTTRGCHAVPVHRAMNRAVTPPAVRKAPPANSDGPAGFVPSLSTASVCTALLTPVPRPAHAPGSDPFHLATPLASPPPGV